MMIGWHMTGDTQKLSSENEPGGAKGMPLDDGLDYRTIFNATTNGMAFTEFDSGRIIDVNAAWIRSTGIVREKSIGKTAFELGLWANRAEREACHAILHKKGRVVDFEARLMMKSTELTYLISAKQVEIDGKRYALWELRDISEQKRLHEALVEGEKQVQSLLAESEQSRRILLSILEDEKGVKEALRTSEDRHRALLQTAMDGFWMADMQGRLLEVNETYCRMSGYSTEELLTMRVSDLEAAETDDDIAMRIQKTMAQGEDRFETRHRRKDRSLFNVEVSVQYRPADGGHLIAFLRDITERKEIEARLQQAQKMEAIGRLAGGVAHDFNNMLGIIMGYADMALDTLHASDPLHENLQEIMAAGRRSTDVVRQLLAFARKQTIAPRVLDLNETVADMLKMLRRLIGEDIDLLWKPAGEPCPVKMDPSQIDQLLANLAVNARGAIRDVGKVTIETRNIVFDADYCQTHTDFKPGHYVMLAVSDDGSGMDKEVLANIFEPFFTTKELGRGTGLGLATVYGIVKQNEGFLNVYSEPERGSTFRIYIPRYEPADILTVETAASATTPTGEETVLLVEDEEGILALTKAMLEKLGYTVLAANTPGEAICLAADHSGKIHLLMTDVVMPQMNGRDLARQLLTLYPKLKSLFMSGYTANIIAHHGVLDEGVHFIQKPFSKKDLSIKVREALDQERTQ
jgi:PAS domain S-box-containing protein